MASAASDHPGEQPRYSDLAIELLLTLRLVFHLALRSAKAFTRSIACAARQHEPPSEMVIPPRVSAVLSADNPDHQTPRDRHIRLRAVKGRMGWQRTIGYGLRSHVETTIGRCKCLIGPKLRVRSLTVQQNDAAIAVKALNRTIRIAKPLSIRRN